MLNRPIRVAVVGDWDRAKLAHFATDAGLYHAAARSRQPLELVWVSTHTVQQRGAAHALSRPDGIVGAPGSPFASMDGMLAAIRFAREHDVPYLGTCAGFQYALIEFSRNVLGLSDADSAENGSASTNVVITPVSCPLPHRPPGSPLMVGEDRVYPVKGSLIAESCGPEPLSGEYFCNFETNPAYVERWQAAGLAVAARDERGNMRAFQLRSNRFFLATLFQPQRASRAEAPHPIIQAFLQACAESDET